MTGYDATFLALACSFLGQRGHRRALTALTPLAVYLIQLSPNAAIQLPLIAVAVIVLSGSQLATGAILALPAYATISEAAVVAILWWTLPELMDLLGSLERHPDRLSSREQHHTLRPGLPRKVMIAGMLYLILYPLVLL